MSASPSDPQLTRLTSGRFPTLPNTSQHFPTTPPPHMINISMFCLYCTLPYSYTTFVHASIHPHIYDMYCDYTESATA
ncbi:hypothetical protein EX30DRAFT_338167 [Ascodesmis nigricans]|uniref:Uncharacterized protein n=1 Tax=Ascodesmis nigricans TaxID=341454 RepID=A0A4S2N385_9PEZI|nr:hypothetical protein EX30DRAFT_338167 [Ascodesmis nigricans]